ncbi:MAG: histidine kinase [Deltaproteobacteria bacterium]|nr:histidine kinase [Deltaproteobacteria bacterium]
MLYPVSLRSRLYAILTSLVLLTMIGGLVMVWYTYRIDRLLNTIIDRNMAAYQAAEALETALVNQKGFVSYYFLDGDPDWLRQLGEYRQIFSQSLETSRRLAENRSQKAAIKKIEAEYSKYVIRKDQVIVCYNAGKRDLGVKFHHAVRKQFFIILELCKQYKQVHVRQIVAAREKSSIQAAKLRAIAWLAMLLEFMLGGILIFILVFRILGPLQKLAREADRERVPEKSADEINALSRSVRELIENVDSTQDELEKSREHLLQTEKLALVGKLAAGMAHSIRNPFTSVKMRLFSLSRTLKLNVTQKEDFDVISEEIRHVDTIVQNFLEFSRPPKLQIQPVSPSTVVDAALQLLKHRLKSYDVSVQVVRKKMLPEIPGDPEQLKEVLVNLVVNACEAMTNGGKIIIHEEERFVQPLSRVAVIRVIDDGPGISESIRDKVLQPFFTTREDGTGLGLSIASRIIEEHGGWMDVISENGRGATFIITLPVKEADFEHHSDH